MTQITKFHVFVISILIGILLLTVGAIPAFSILNHEVRDSPTIKAKDTSDLNAQSILTNPSVEWDRVFGEKYYSLGKSICADSDGGSVVTGTVNDNTVLIKTDDYGNLEWNTSFDSGLTDWGRCVRQTTNGDYIVTGCVDGYTDMWFFSHVGLLRYDYQGNLLWNRSMKFGGCAEGESVLQTSDQGFLVLGTTSEQRYSVLLIKTDALGNEQWHRIYGGNTSDFGVSLTCATDGGYDILCRTDHYPDDSTFWLLHIDENGTELWNRTISTPNGWIASMSATDDGGPILIGSHSSLRYLPSDAWLIKVNATGFEEWNKTYEGPLFAAGCSVRQTLDGGYVFVGYNGSVHGYEPDTLRVVKIDADGTEQWNRSILSNLSCYGLDITTTSDGMFVITGSFDHKIWILKIADEPPQAKRKALLIGTINNLETEGAFITFQAHNLWYFQRFPLKINHYGGNEYVTISQNYIGILRPKFIGCLSRG